MKKASFVLILSIILFSCSKDDEVHVTTEHINISNTETYQYDLGQFGFEDGAIISKQAEHYELSELNRNETIIYTYKSQEGYLGSDKVKIEIITGSDGSSSGKVSKIVEINFNISE